MAPWQVETYRLYQFAGNTSETRAIIRLADSVSGNAVHAYFTTANPLPPNNITSTIYFLYFPYDNFLPMMEMLREEKPIWVQAPNQSTAYIGTHPEPIGEDEGP